MHELRKLAYALVRLSGHGLRWPASAGAFQLNRAWICGGSGIQVRCFHLCQRAPLLFPSSQIEAGRCFNRANGVGHHRLSVQSGSTDPGVSTRPMSSKADRKREDTMTRKTVVDGSAPLGDEAKMPSALQRFKLYFKKYWYVLVPVHVVTSAFWFGTFYYMAVSGIDIIGLLRSLNVSESLINKLNRAPNAGHIALAYGLFKLASPLRYTVTVAGTAVSVRYLVRLGWIKPAPTRAQVKSYVDLKKRQIRTRYERWRSKSRTIARKNSERRKGL